MKKLICVVLILALLCPFASAMGMANPWRETTPEELVEVLGLSLCEPEGAENVFYWMLESESLAEMQFVLDDVKCVARIKPAVDYEDISGMYYEWENVWNCTVNWCAGELMETTEDGQKISICMWYDVAPGLMYSLSATGGLDALELAEKMFVPAQGDVDATPADALAQALAGCTGYAGTAGSSLKEAIAAVGVLEFCIEYAEVENLEETVQSAWSVLSEEQLQELAFSLDGIQFVIDSAFADFESIAGLFDDAGVIDQMQALIQTEDAQENWDALNTCLAALQAA